MQKDTNPTRYSLLSRLENWGDQKSWMEFYETYWRLIHSVAIRAGLSEAEAHDVVQETVLSVAKDIHKFKRNRELGSFKGWLRNIIRWRIADQLRKRKPFENDVHHQPNGLNSLDLAVAENSPGAELESIWEREWREKLFDAAIARVKLQVKEEQFQIFDLYVIKGWSVAKIIKTLKVSAGRVYLAKHRVSILIKKELRTLESNLF